MKKVFKEKVEVFKVYKLVKPGGAPQSERTVWLLGGLVRSLSWGRLWSQWVFQFLDFHSA